MDRLGCPPLFIYSGVDFPLLSSEKTTGLWKKQKKSKIILDWSVPYPGHELIENGRTQVQRLGGTLLQDEVVGISWNGNYLISTASTQIEAALSFSPPVLPEKQ